MYFDHDPHIISSKVLPISLEVDKSHSFMLLWSSHPHRHMLCYLLPTWSSCIFFITLQVVHQSTQIFSHVPYHFSAPAMATKNNLLLCPTCGYLY